MQVRKVASNYNCKTGSITFKQVVENRIAAEAIKGNNYLLLVSGPSGVGKDTVMNVITDYFNKIVTHTTRAKRINEVDGVNYFFTTSEKFVEGIKNNEFVEWIKGFAGHYYGTKKETIKNALNGNKPALAIIDVDGAKTIRENLRNDPNIKVVSIFFKPPSLKVLEKRLRGRGSETTENVIQERLGRAQSEINRAGEYDAVIQFNSPEEGASDVRELLHLN